MKIPFQNPNFTISDIFKSLYMNNGVKKLKFELEKYHCKNNFFITKTARQSLWIILEAIRNKEKKEVIVSSFTAPVVPLAIIKSKCTPVFCDVIKNHFMINFEDVRKKITQSTLAIIVPYTFGCYENIDKYISLGKEFNIYVIEDCAQTFDGVINGKKIGFNADFSIWSFGISKCIASINGGAIWCKEENRNMIEKSINRLKLKNENIILNKILMSIFVIFIKTKVGFTTLSCIKEKYQNYREINRCSNVNTLEFETKITNFEASLIVQQIKRYEKIKEKRKKNFLMIKDELKTYVQFPKEDIEYDMDYLYAPVVLDKNERDKLLNKYSFTKDINFTEIEQWEPLKKYQYITPNRKILQEKYLLISIHNNVNTTKKMIYQLKNFFRNYRDEYI